MITRILALIATIPSRRISYERQKKKGTFEMSTEFTTEPRLTYDQVLASQRLIAEAPERNIYAGRRHALIKSRTGAPVGRLTLFEEDGCAGFERFGGQNPEILLLVAEEFGVKVYDQHGLRYPDESDG